MLAFLLDPKQSPYKNKFLELFLQELQVSNWKKLIHSQISVETEPPLHSDERKSYCDIKISFSDKQHKNVPQNIIFIENKITSKAIKKQQLEQQVNGFRQYYSYFI